MKKTIRDYEIKGKKVLLRADLNVPMKDGVITDDNRIKESLETILYALEKGAKVIVLSHLGRIKTEEDKKKNTLKPVAERLAELLNKPVHFIPETRGKSVEEAVNKLEEGEIVLLENTRYEDLDGKKESTNDPILGSYWASLGDIFINDAFGTTHRAHASNVGIASHLPSGIGFLIEKELQYFEKAMQHPERPFTVILGGAKVADKIEVTKNLAPKVDYLLIGGGMAYTFLKASGLGVGKSLVDLESIDFCREMLEKYPDKIILPIDSVNTVDMDEAKAHTVFVSDTKEEEMGLDIGYGTIKLFMQHIKDSKTVIWNGPVGMFEKEAFREGTKAICEGLSEIEGTTIIGGGDTASAVIHMGYADQVSHISTGGGASLALLEGKTLPGIEGIENIWKRSQNNSSTLLF